MHWNVCGTWRSYDAYICVDSVVYHQGSYNANWPMDSIARVLESVLCCLDDDLIYMYVYKCNLRNISYMSLATLCFLVFYEDTERMGNRGNVP